MPESFEHGHIPLARLFPEQALGRFADFPVGALRLDSRQVQRGDTFVAVRGARQDGRDYIDAAISAGARLILCEAENEFSIAESDGVLRVSVPQLRDNLSALAASWYDNPSRLLSLVGVTGTNGKTTCCQWLVQLVDGLPGHVAEESQVRAGSVGTLGYGMAGETPRNTGLTTPDAITLQSILAHLVAVGANTVVAEVSSHSLDQGRVAALDFDVAVFTNIGRDHLDYHGDLMSYVAAKTRLMRFVSLKSAIINLDDDFSPQFLRQVDSMVQTVTYSLRELSADFSAEQVRFSSRGTEATLITPEGKFPVSLPIWGEFNLRNLLAVLASAYALGHPLPQLIERLKLIRPVPGRLEAVNEDTDITVLVDYAHTPDALQSVLAAVRSHASGNVWCVFGCGGDRDRGKRPLMAQVVESLADYVVVTTDNPRAEDPEVIIDDVMTGFKQPQAVHRIEDRETAIRFAVEQAASGDCVLIAGKGHEEYQLVGTRRIPFSDLAVARLALGVRPQLTQAGSRDWEGEGD